MPPETAKLLWDMLTSAQRIESFTTGKSLEDYRRDELLRSAVERQFEIIGEAMSRLLKVDSALAGTISDYRKIASFRNVLIHGYDSIDDVISWGIVQSKLPILRAELERLLNPPP
jgi:uncharacterized protein with HEPN domain